MECFNSQYDDYQLIGKFEVSQMLDDALLMSFLDDSQVEECCDNEKLSSVMRSLEAEIHQRIIHVDHEYMAVDKDNLNTAANWKNDDDHSLDHDDHILMEGYDETSGAQQQDELMDMEMIMNVMDHDHDHDKMEAAAATVLRFENYDDHDHQLIDYYFDHFNNTGISFDEDREVLHGPYGTFWQEPLAN